MKRIFFLSIFLLMASAISFAQDIIVTTDAQKIEAKILEVFKMEIKYKEWDNLDGPLFTLATSEICTITYSNGKVVTYNQPSQSAQVEGIDQTVNIQQAASQHQPIATAATILLRSGHTLTGEIVEMNSRYIAYLDNGERKTMPASQIQSVTLSNGQVKIYDELVHIPSEEQTTSSTVSSKPTHSRIYRDNGEYMYNDTYISAKEVARILERENKAAYKQWKKAEGLVIGGSVCVGIGAGLAVGGLATLISGNNTTCIIMDCVALVPLGIGLGLTIGASAQYNKAIDIYNSKYDNAAIHLRWSIATNGIGLALAF